MPIIVGIDPGTETAGYCILRKGIERGVKVLAHGTVKETKPKHRMTRMLTMAAELRKRLSVTLGEHVLLAIERPFVGKNADTAIALGEARGVICAALSNMWDGVTITDYMPTDIRRRMGLGGDVPKINVQKRVRLLLNLNEPLAKGFDESDAIAIAWCHASELGWV